MKPKQIISETQEWFVRFSTHFLFRSSLFPFQCKTKHRNAGTNFPLLPVILVYFFKTKRKGQTEIRQTFRCLHELNYQDFKVVPVWEQHERIWTSPICSFFVVTKRSRQGCGLFFFGFLSAFLLVVILSSRKINKDKTSMNFRALPEELCVQTCILCIIKKLLSTSTCLCLLIHPHCSPIRSYTFMSLKILLLPVICQSQLLPEYPGWLSICYQSRITFTYSENLCFSSWL